MRRSITSLVVVACSWAALPAAVLAQQMLHQRVDEPRRDEGPMVEQPAEGENPAALRLGGRELPEPDHTDQLASGELPFEAGPGDASTLGRPPVWRPDLLTGVFPEHLQYTATFTPSISPYKRVAVFDVVGPGYELSVGETLLVDVPVGGSAEEGREIFWGSVAVRFRPHRPVPIPSVAAGARVLSVKARPDRQVRFLRDGADNFFAVSATSGQTRLVFVTDASPSYFGGPLPGNLRSSAVPEELRPSLPPAAMAAAGRVAARLGLDRNAPISRNLTRLVTYLRAFRPEALDVPSGADPYVALALGRRGVCRHRAFVFVVTAQALGIPARFVTNEAHAFAEAFIPSVGWRRIDLGGAGPLVDPSSPVTRHEPRQRDSIPWPRGQASSGASRSSPQGPSPRGRGEGGSGSQRISPADAEGGGRQTPLGPEEAADAVLGEPDGSAGADAGAPTPTPSRARAVVVDHAPQVIRGEGLLVAGRVEGARGAALSRLRVVLWLRSAGGADELRLGSVIPDENGSFRMRLAVPSDLPAGDYSIGATLAGR